MVQELSLRVNGSSWSLSTRLRSMGPPKPRETEVLQRRRNPIGTSERREYSSNNTRRSHSFLLVWRSSNFITSETFLEATKTTNPAKGQKPMNRRIQKQGVLLQHTQSRFLLSILFLFSLLLMATSADELRSRGFSSTTSSAEPKVNNDSIKTTTSKYTKPATAEEQSFMQWCQDFFGIHTLLEIAHFTYDAAVLQVNVTNELEGDLLPSVPSPTSNETILIRGLAAKEDIQPGDVVIRIPINALIIRDSLGDLAKYVLLESNASVPMYRQIVLDHAERHHHQWIFDTKVLSVQSETFRIMARNLRDEMNSLYRDWETDNKPSFEDFSWAFQLVNGRHWRVPFHEAVPHRDESIETPPANTPTQSWVQDSTADDDDELAMTTHHHIKPFLAPIADLVNFGPPCTRVRTDHGFELISTCQIPKGHEVTFWYSDMCADAVLAVYGMTSEMIAPCKSAMEWKQKAVMLEKRLLDAVEDIEILETELEEAESVLSDCCDYDDVDEENGPSLRRGVMGRTRSKRYMDDEEF